MTSLSAPGRIFHNGVRSYLLLALFGFVLATQFVMAQDAGLQWHPQVSPNVPGDGAIVGGPGNGPERNSPLFVCRTSVQGATQPGKWENGNCDVLFHGKELFAKTYEVAYGTAEWRPYEGKAPDLLQTGNEADGTPIYSCRISYKDHGYQPGKISLNACHIGYDGKEKVEPGSFQALYVIGSAGRYVPMPGSVNTPPPEKTHSGGGFWSKMTANAKYQQAKQNGASNAQLDAIKNGSSDDVPPNSSRTHPSASNMPPCRSEDPGAHLENGNWVGPNCMTEPDNGHYVTDEEAAKQREALRSNQDSQNQSSQEKRAAYLENHACMTTNGADKANELAADCEKVTTGTHKGCSIQQNTCDEIRDATRRGCNALAAEGPDWCLTRYN